MEMTHQQLTTKDIVLGLTALVGIIGGSVLITFYGYSTVLETFSKYIPDYIPVTNIINLLESTHHLFIVVPGLAWFILLQGLGLAVGIIVSIANNY